MTSALLDMVLQLLIYSEVLVFYTVPLKQRGEKNPPGFSAAKSVVLYISAVMKNMLLCLLDKVHLSLVHK